MSFFIFFAAAFLAGAFFGIATFLDTTAIFFAAIM